MEELRRKHERHAEEDRAAEMEKEERRKVRAQAERVRRSRAVAEQAQAGSSSTPSSGSITSAPWPQRLPITGAADAATNACREADKRASLEQAAEHSAHLRQQEEERVQEAIRKMKLLRLADQIQRGD
jgi:hypothetical protein